MIYDISPVISERLQVWPGDTPPSREVLLDMKRGDNLTLSTLHGTVHLGAHADGPNHYGTHAPAIDQRPLEPYLGPCQVLRINLDRGTRLKPSDLTAEVDRERVLFATDTYPDPDNFNEDFGALSPELIGHLYDRGVRLVGIDTPSIDLFRSKDLPSHQKALEHDLCILEGLVLNKVPEGHYELIALPLPLEGFDASPVRAILRSSNE